MIVTACNDDDLLAKCLAASPDVKSGRQVVHAERSAKTAGQAYNRGLDVAGSDARYVVFAHQDIYFPAGWFDKLEAAIDDLEARDEPWGVIGVWGIRPDGGYAGRVWCSGAGKEHVAELKDGEVAAEVMSIDEIVIVVNPRTGLRFDDALPGFHLYATDVILEARKMGLKAFAINAPVVHNSRPNPNPFDSHFFAGYRHMAGKWSEQLPLRTCTVPVTKWGWPLRKRWLQREVRKLRGRGPSGQRVDNPAAVARQLGYEGSDGSPEPASAAA